MAMIKPERTQREQASMILRLPSPTYFVLTDHFSNLMQHETLSFDGDGGEFHVFVDVRIRHLDASSVDGETRQSIDMELT